jgi:hypothetical protein
MQNWMAGFIIAACLFYGFLLVSRNEQQAAQNNGAQAALAPAPARTLTADNASADGAPAITPTPAPAGMTALSFGGYPCGTDCAVQEQGFQWAERNNITDADACTGNSAEFIEGCRVYAMRRTGSG